MNIPEADEHDEGYDEEDDGDAVSGKKDVNDAFVFLKRNTRVNVHYIVIYHEDIIHILVCCSPLQVIYDFM